MRARRLLPALVVLGASAPAAADLEATAPCAEHIDDPVTLPWRDSGIDGGRGGCLHADVAVRLGARALVDTPDFYGTLGGDATVQIRLLEGQHPSRGSRMPINARGDTSWFQERSIAPAASS